MRIGERAFTWLKTGRIGRKSAKQAETGLANLRKILSIAVSGACGPPANAWLALISRKNG
jgi:hypothetical protein